MTSYVTSRVFGACRAMLSPAKSSAAVPTAAVTPKTAKLTTPPKPKSIPKPKRTPPAKPAGILKSTPVSPALRSFLGVPEASRANAVKKIWEHIKQNCLQNPHNKREIICDEKLKFIFGKERVGFLEIGKLLTPHFVKTR